MEGLGDQINNIDEGHHLAGYNHPLAEAVEDENADAGQANGPMHWTNVQSCFMLRRFHDLVKQGVKTDKSFKEVHVR
jgi:hypothetical protein